MRVSIYRKAYFNAAHRLYVPQWSEEKNNEMFGRCANPNFHGHNYEIEVKVTGEVDPVTGLVMDLKVLKELIRQKIEDKFDHRNLNVDIPEFAEKRASAENFCILIHDILRQEIKPELDLQVRLYESARNWVEYPSS